MRPRLAVNGLSVWDPLDTVEPLDSCRVLPYEPSISTVGRQPAKPCGTPSSTARSAAESDASGSATLEPVLERRVDGEHLVEPREFEHESQVVAQVGGIHHADDGVRRPLDAGLLDNVD